MTKNYGLIAEPLSPEDWLMGSSGLGMEIRRPDGDWSDYLPTGEKQKRQDTDKMACVSFSACSDCEVEFEYPIQNKTINTEDLQWLHNNGYMDENGKPDFSDRYIAIASGTSKNGNSPKRVAKAIATRTNKSKEFGLIPETMLPYRKNMTWFEYYGYDKVPATSKLITPEMRALGQEFLKRFPINYEFVNGGMKEYNEARKYNPVQVFIHAYNGVRNGKYLRTTSPVNHAVLNHNENQIFDSYDPFIKNMASNFIYMRYGTRFIIQIEKEEVKKKLWTHKNLMNYIRRIFAERQMKELLPT